MSLPNFTILKGIEKWCLDIKAITPAITTAQNERSGHNLPLPIFKLRDRSTSNDRCFYKTAQHSESNFKIECSPRLLWYGFL